MFDANGFCPLLFESIQFRTPNEMGVLDYLSNGLINFGFNAQVLNVQIDKGYFHQRVRSGTVIRRKSCAGLPA